MAIPLPRRSLRSLVVFLCIVLGPYFFVRHISSISQADSSPSAAYSYLSGSSSKRVESERQVAERDLGDDLVFQQDDPLLIGSSKATEKGKIRMARHTFLPNGLLEVKPEGQHPIHDLIEQGERTWGRKLEQASRTLGEAVNEYRRRYGRAPPKGFDRWWTYSQKNNVQLPDEYDQINQDLEPFHALTPIELQELRLQASSFSGMYTISCPGRTSTKTSNSSRCTSSIVEKGLNLEGRVVANQRAEAQLSLLKDIEGELEAVEAVFYSHDVPWQFVGHEYKTALEDAAAVGEYLNVEEHELDWAHLGWASACAPHKPLRQTYDTDVLPDLEAMWDGPKTFIWDHKAAMDPCIHPTMTHLVGFLSGHGKGPGPSKELYPVMAMCKTTLHSDVLAVSMEAWTEDVGIDPPWEEKTDDRMLWRGKTTGIYFKDGVPWNISQRINLVSHTARTTGFTPVYDISEPFAAVGAPRDTALSRLNSELVDVGFVDEAIQCDPEVCAEIGDTYKFAGRKDWDQGNQHKYLLDIDGNGWSARFKRLMSTNSVVVKSTIFPEWYTDRIQPWVHYVPVKADLTDLYDVLTFFRGGHDDLARNIAVAGKDWSKTFWRKEDMVSYQFRLFLELSRLMAPHRDKASYHVRGADLD